jgi:hypothetical protein
MKRDNQQTIEEIHKKQQNFFYETISKKMEDYASEKNQKEIMRQLAFLKESLIADNGFEISPIDYALLGCMSYLVGIDYTSQAYLNKKVAENVFLRFDKYKFHKVIISNYVSIIEIISEKNLMKVKNDLKNKILDDIIFSEAKDKITFNEIRANIKSVINNSLIPINMANSIHDILSKQVYNLDDVVKMNTFLNKNCTYLGKKAINPLIKTYSNQLWIELLKNSMKLFDNQKFTILYFDSILSVHESLVKFDKSILESYILGKTSKIDFEGLQNKFESEQAEIKADKNAVTPVTKEEAKDLGENKPIEYIFGLFSDFLKFIPTNEEDVISAIDRIIEDQEYGQYIYHYVKGNLDKIKFEEFTTEIDFKKLCEKLKSNIDELKSEYKVKIEKTCQDISADYIAKIVDLVNICISDLVMENDQQKQYLSSQLMENGITTFNHLQQILMLIEGCQIIGSELNSYVFLYNYLKEKTNIMEIFEENKNAEQLQLKISFYMLFNTFFDKIVKLYTVE